MRQGGAIPDFNGAVLAEVLAPPLASDFAAADLRLGGAGGPMGASLAHALARMAPEKGPLLLLEIDSAPTRATYANPSLKADKDGALLAFEAPPAFRPSPIPAPEAAPTRPRSTASSPIHISCASRLNWPSLRP